MTNPITYWSEWWNDLHVAERITAMAILVIAVLVPLEVVYPATAERNVVLVPIDVVALVQAVFTGVAAVGGVFATIYSLIAANRAKQAAAAVHAVNDTMKMVEQNTNSITEQLTTAARKEGLQEGETKGRLAGVEIAKELVKTDPAKIEEKHND